MISGFQSTDLCEENTNIGQLKDHPTMQSPRISSNSNSLMTDYQDSTGYPLILQINVALWDCCQYNFGPISYFVRPIVSVSHCGTQVCFVVNV